MPELLRSAEFWTAALVPILKLLGAIVPELKPVFTDELIASFALLLAVVFASIRVKPAVESIVENQRAQAHLAQLNAAAYRNTKGNG